MGFWDSCFMTTLAIYLGEGKEIDEAIRLAASAADAGVEERMRRYKAGEHPFKQLIQKFEGTKQ